MTEITSFARKELEHEAWGKQSYSEYYQLMHTLLITIESLTSERDKFRLEAMNERELGESIVAEREQLYASVESLQKDNMHFEQRMKENHSIAMGHAVKLDEQADLLKSQKEEIEKWKKESFANHPTQWAYDKACAALNKKTSQIESLKAITELAVKGLKEVANDGIAVEESSHGELMEFIASLKKKLDSTLSEIAKLSHE